MRESIHKVISEVVGFDYCMLSARLAIRDVSNVYMQSAHVHEVSTSWPLAHQYLP
jgi:hypothetical protein